MSETLTFRKICPEDLQKIKKMHEELFPIRYDDNFYLEACAGRGMNAGELFSNIAFHDEEMVGFILAQFVPIIGEDERSLVGPASPPPRELCYILTIGTDKAHRRHGLASQLLNSCMEYAKSNKSCGAVYLHVIDYNSAAIAFYEKNDFQFFKELPDFYHIRDKWFTSFLYVHYLNGFKAPLSQRLVLQTRGYLISIYNFALQWCLSWIRGVDAQTEVADKVRYEELSGLLPGESEAMSQTAGSV